jgi:hypothetical protein
MGPMTGRQAGYCAGYNMPGYANPIGGRGRGFRNRAFPGRGLGFRPYGNPYPYPYQAPVQRDPEAERQALSQQAEMLKRELEMVDRQLSELDKESGQE